MRIGRIVGFPIGFHRRSAGESELRMGRGGLALLRPGRREPLEVPPVGLSGVAVNEGILLALPGAMNPLIVDADAIESSILRNFPPNELWTFRGRWFDRSPRGILRRIWVHSAAACPGRQRTPFSPTHGSQGERVVDRPEDVHRARMPPFHHVPDLLPA